MVSGSASQADSKFGVWVRFIPYAVPNGTLTASYGYWYSVIISHYRLPRGDL